jgi:hypothetical protein
VWLDIEVLADRWELDQEYQAELEDEERQAEFEEYLEWLKEEGTRC